MTQLRFLSRQQINDTEWDRCVREAHNTLLYGYSWYLDAVTNVPVWRWEGLVQPDAAGAGYVAVLPVPLRRRWGRWVVYQPLFCQFLAIFSQQPVDTAPFLEALVRRYRFASRLCLLLSLPEPNVPAPMQQRVGYTHLLAVGSAAHVANRYTADRRMNLRRARQRVAQTPDWQVIDSTDVLPLLALFRTHHAANIGVGEWAYGLFDGLFQALQQRGLVRLRYAYVGNVLVAGVLFAEQYGRIIYLFNAASARGRHLNARTLLLHEALTREAAQPPATGVVFDFESPDVPAIARFYESFGATPTPYLQLSWSRLTRPERWLQQLVKALRVRRR